MTTIMARPDGLTQTQVATFVHAFPGETAATIADGLVLSREFVGKALIHLQSIGVVRRSTVGYDGVFWHWFPTDRWSPEEDTWAA